MTFLKFQDNKSGLKIKSFKSKPKSKNRIYDYIENKSHEIRNKSNFDSLNNNSDGKKASKNTFNELFKEEKLELIEREISGSEERKLRKALSENLIFNELTDELL